MNNGYAINKSKPEYWEAKHYVKFCLTMEIPEEEILNQIEAKWGIPSGTGEAMIFLANPPVRQRIKTTSTMRFKPV